MMGQILKSILRGKMFLRSLMNYEFFSVQLYGHVLDIGGGKSPSYFKFFKKDNTVELTTVDIEKLDKPGHLLDLEKNQLPYQANVFDQVLIINFLEHIYNYRFVSKETRRVLKNSGEIIGFVPFLINVHPDPHDYFRYTREALERIFKETGFKDIKITTIGRGPLAVNFNIVAPLFPGIITVWFLPCVLLFDWVILKLRPVWRERFPLGYTFYMKK